MIFRILFALTLVINMVIVGRYRRRAQAGERFSLKEEGAPMVIALRGLGLACMVYLLVLVFAPGWVQWSVVSLPTWARASGALLGLVIVPPLIVWAQRHLGRNVSTTVITREHHELVTEGLYRYIRHPLYVNGLLLYTSLGLMSGSWLLFVCLVIGFMLLVVRTRKEEAMLEARFGEEYVAYRTRTGRFLPRWSSFAGR